MNKDKKQDERYKPSETERFVNPYHFVSLEKNCNREIKKYKDRKGSLTGWITCRLETLSPIFIPNTSSQLEIEGKKQSDVFKKRVTKDGKEVIINSYDFFSYTDLSVLEKDQLKGYREPVIPGSEIRGVIRSAFEAVTNSCLSTIDDEKPLFKRVQTPAKAAQILYDKEKKEWILIECNRNRINKNLLKQKNQPPFKEGESVYVEINYKNFKVRRISRKMDNRYKNAFIHIGEYNENKDYESVFIPKRDKKNKQLITRKISKNEIPIILDNLIHNILIYRAKENKTEKHNQYSHLGNLKSIENLVIQFNNNQINYEKFNIMLQQEYPEVFKYLNGALIYFAKHNSKYYLCPAAIGREVFYNRLTDIIGDYKPCENLSQLCPACSLFGIASKETAAASRIRFTDAIVSEKRSTNKEYYHEERILKELAGPKLSATEFYLKKNITDADLWNYDYAINWKSHENGIPNYEAEIRGRKFYWHHTNPAPYIPKDKEGNETCVSDRNVAVRPLKEGVYFKFKVYFNDITKTELNRLLWILSIGNKKENAHKIGMGKPIGLGSVQINIDGIYIRVVAMNNETIEYTVKDRFEDYKDFTDMNYNDLGCSVEVINEFDTLTRIENSFSEIIAYPSNVNEEENYNWFMENKKINGTGTQPIIEESLPSVKDPVLRKYEKFV